MGRDEGSFITIGVKMKREGCEAPVQAVFLVLEQEEYLEELLEALFAEGISGATVLESTGMGKIMADHVPIFASLRNIMGDNNIIHNHTVFLVVEDQDVAKTLQVVEGVLGDLNRPNTGVFFSVPVAFAKGLRKIDDK